MLKRTLLKNWTVALLALGLIVFSVGCSEDDDTNDPVQSDENVPVLSGPADGAVATLSATSQFLLSWDAVDSASAYMVQVAVDNGFAGSALVIETEVEATEYDLQLTRVVFGSEYYWRVKSMLNDGSESEYSEARSFTLEAPAVTGVEVLSGDIEADMTLDATKTYLLRGGVFVGYDDVTEATVTLTIPAGTTILGEKATDGMLVIRRTGKIMAEGTAAAPIVMTSDQPVGSRNRGDWGGLIINGQATLNTGAEAIGEGDTGLYGGTNDSHSSGTLNYVRVEFAGREISPDNELNGIAFQGVGSGTVVDYVQVHMNKDDGIEFFGGTVRAKHVLCTGIGDDSFDWTDGWRGYGQFWVAQQYGTDADQGFENDNSGDNNVATPYSNATISNFTLIGDKQGDESDIGMLLREGTKGQYYNGIVMNFGDCAVDVDHSQTFTNVANGELVVDYCIFDTTSATGNAALGQEDDTPTFDEDTFITSTMQNNEMASSAVVSDGLSKNAPDYTSTGLAITKTPLDPTTLDSWFDAVSFIGGVDPANDWTAGWTIHVTN